MKKRAVTKRVIFHHSLSKDVSADIIREWHKERGFSDIGYHFVVRADGSVEQGRSIELIGAHAKGKNSDSIGVCVAGDFSKYAPGMDQYEGARDLYISLCTIFGKLDLEYHHETCPGEKFDRAGFSDVCIIEESL